MKVLLTGVSSFTGAHIAHALVEKGHDVLATLSKNPEDYSEALIQKRFDLAKGVEFFPGAVPFRGTTFS